MRQQLGQEFHQHGEKKTIKETMPAMSMRWKDRLNLLLVEWLETNSKSSEEGNLKSAMLLDIAQVGTIKKKIPVSTLTFL